MSRLIAVHSWPPVAAGCVIVITITMVFVVVIAGMELMGG